MSVLKCADGSPSPVASPAFRRLTERLHACGPRPVGEALGLAFRRRPVSDREFGLGEIERVAALGPDVVAALDARGWPPQPLTSIAGGRR